MMAAHHRQEERREGPLTGIGDALVFLVFVAIGAAYIVWSKTAGLPAAAVTMVPVAIMLAYAAALLFIRAMRLRDDQSGDNLYYMGFLFTLTSLAVSLWQFDAEGAAEDIVRNFGVAIASTIAGIALRIFLNQMRRDPVRTERAARTQLADAARRVRRELDATVMEFSQFRRAAQQAAAENWTAVREEVAATGRGVAEELRSSADASIQPIQEASLRSGAAVDGLARSLTEATGRIDEQAARLAAGVDGLTAALEGFTARMSALGEPDRIVAMKVEPVISPLAAMVESFGHSLTMHAESLRHLTDALAAASEERSADRQALDDLRASLAAVTSRLDGLPAPAGDAIPATAAEAATNDPSAETPARRVEPVPEVTP